MNTLLNILYGLLALGILVFVHELGHFLMAKLFGVKVETFSIGMGTGIFRIQRGDTVYQIGYIPLGGFCKMAGEEPGDELTGAPDEFYSKSPQKRLGIVFAGPFVNYVFGIILFILVMFIGMKQETSTNKIAVMKKVMINTNEVVSPAAKAGMKTGDHIIKIEDKEIHNWTMIIKTIMMSGDKKKRKITVKRGNRKIDLNVTPIVDPDTGASIIGITPYISNELDQIQLDSPAEKAGLEAGDKIVKINNKRVVYFSDIKDTISKKTNQWISVIVNREGKLKRFRIKTKTINKKGYIGVIFHTDSVQYVQKSDNINTAIKDGFQRGNKVIKNIIYSFKLIFSGKVKVKKAVGSPVAIIYLAGKTAEAGIMSFIWFMGYISVALAFFNLLPIPAVDGSYIIFFLFELISRRKLNFKIIRVIQYVGLILIMGLLMFFVFNDFLKLFNGGFNSVKAFIS